MTDEAKAEREAVVRWLRAEADTVIGALCYSDQYDTEAAELDAALIESIAQRIERGEHSK